MFGRGTTFSVPTRHHTRYGTRQNAIQHKYTTIQYKTQRKTNELVRNEIKKKKESKSQPVDKRDRGEKEENKTKPKTCKQQGAWTDERKLKQRQRQKLGQLGEQ